MRVKTTTKIVIFLLFSTAAIGAILSRAPMSLAASLTFTCNAAGSGLSYYGEVGQTVHFAATFEDEYPSMALNYSYGGAWSQSAATNVINNLRSWYIDIILADYLSGNDTGQFHFWSGSSNTTPIMTINIADAHDPANATNVVIVAQAGGKARVTWSGGLFDYIDGNGLVSDNVELYSWEVHRHTPIQGPFTDKGSYSPADLVGTVSPTTFQYIDTTPSDGAYYYTVIARDRAGYGSDIPKEHKETPGLELITTDRVAPTVLTYTMNGTSYLATNSHVNLPFGGILKVRFTVDNYVQNITTAKLIISTTYNGNPIQVEYGLNSNETGQYFWIDIETQPVGAEELRLGVYDVRLEFTDQAGNLYTKEYPDQISIYTPNPFLEALMWIVPVAVGALVAGYVATKKLKQRRIANLQKVDAPGAKKRKGQIFKGASDLGRASGDEAEVILAKRKRAEAEAESKPRTKAKEGRSKVGRETLPSLSLAAPSSFEAAPVKAERFDTISATASTKEVRALEKSQMIDPSKRVGFIEGRVTNLENVMSIAVNLVEMIPEAPPCDKCGKPLNPSWSSCPWCRVTAQSDELEMKLAISGMDGAKMNVCPTCRAPLNPAWSKCPYCATRKV